MDRKQIERSSGIASATNRKNRDWWTNFTDYWIHLLVIYLDTGVITLHLRVLMPGLRPVPKVNNVHDRAVKASKVAPFRRYGLRHAWATRAAESGIDLVTPAALLGHSKIQMVLRACPSDPRASGAVCGVHGAIHHRSTTCARRKGHRRLIAMHSMKSDQIRGTGAGQIMCLSTLDIFRLAFFRGPVYLSGNQHDVRIVDAKMSSKASNLLKRRPRLPMVSL